MYLGPLSMDYTGAVAKETRYIVSLDRLVKKQHIWGFHQGLMIWRKVVDFLFVFACLLFFVLPEFSVPFSVLIYWFILVP